MKNTERGGKEKKREKGDAPDPGVIATSPATTPEQNPTVDHFLSNR